jgi:hypothetical protein
MYSLLTDRRGYINKKRDGLKNRLFFLIRIYCCFYLAEEELPPAFAEEALFPGAPEATAIPPAGLALHVGV